MNGSVELNAREQYDGNGLWSGDAQLSPGPGIVTHSRLVPWTRWAWTSRAHGPSNHGLDARNGEGRRGKERDIQDSARLVAPVSYLSGGRWPLSTTTGGGRRRSPRETPCD